VNKGTEVYRILGDEGMKQYKESITDTNMKELREVLECRDSLFHKIWPFITENFTRDKCFPNGPVKSLIETYPTVAKQMREYGLPLPDFWEHDYHF
jgi:hypothetical protein